MIYRRVRKENDELYRIRYTFGHSLRSAISCQRKWLNPAFPLLKISFQIRLWSRDHRDQEFTRSGKKVSPRLETIAGWFECILLSRPWNEVLRTFSNPGTKRRSSRYAKSWQVNIVFAILFSSSFRQESILSNDEVGTDRYRPETQRSSEISFTSLKGTLRRRAVIFEISFLAGIVYIWEKRLRDLLDDSCRRNEMQWNFVYPNTLGNRDFEQ